MAKLIPLPILPPPGVVKTESKRAIEGRWLDSTSIRFVKGRPQKIGGFVSAVATPTDGTPRTLHAWRDNQQNQYLAAGTYKKLYVYDTSFVQNDITPYASEGSLGTDPFATTNGSSIVTVTDAGHGTEPGALVTFAGATAVNSIDMNGTFTVLTMINSSSYTVDTGVVASGTGSGGGASVTYAYEINVGTELGVYGLGWGVGGWGLGTWGTARSSSSIFFEPRIWSLDHYGKLLIASYNGGSIYEFDPTVAQPWGRAELISADPGLPTNCRYVLVTPERFIFALLDNMQVAWCDQVDYTIWTPATGNTANIRTLTEGTKLVAGRVLSDFVTLIWTDAALYRFQYTGSTYIYNSSMISKNCGLIAPGAAVTVGGVAYWMGQNTFWMFDGTVRPMPNVEDIRDYVFKTLKVDYGYQCTAVFNPRFNEIDFFYTVDGETNPTLGVKYSIENQCWAPIKFGRVSGTHFTQGDTRPYMGLGNGDIYQHENGLDDNGVILPWALSLSPYAMDEGRHRMDIEGIVPDFFEQAGEIEAEITTWDRLNDTVAEDTETETIAAQDSGIIDFRLSGRYVAMELSCSELGSYFRWGKPVAWIKTSGERR